MSRYAKSRFIGSNSGHRAETRAKAQRQGIRPPRGGQPGQTLVQENALVVPASFSPLI